MLPVCTQSQAQTRRKHLAVPSLSTLAPMPVHVGFDREFVVSLMHDSHTRQALCVPYLQQVDAERVPKLRQFADIVQNEANAA